MLSSSTLPPRYGLPVVGLNGIRPGARRALKPLLGTQLAASFGGGGGENVNGGDLPGRAEVRDNTLMKIELIAALNQLQNPDGSLSPPQAEGLAMRVLQPLLESDGYSVQHRGGPGDQGIDFLAKRERSNQHSAQSIGIQFKYRRPGRTLGTAEVDQLARVPAVVQDLDRLILLANTKFTLSARERARRILPVAIELMDIDALRAWVDRLDLDKRDSATEVRKLVRELSRGLALMIAKDPDALESIEWRQLEETIAEIFEGIGFKVTLTPGSKDGGKDVILECEVQGRRASYVIEVKHWRSRTRVGGAALAHFLNVIAREKHDGGLFLSTYGYCDNAFQQLNQVDRERLRFGEKEKIVAVCRRYEKATSGIWSPPENLADLLYEETI
jgi:restriction endonuclease Mrr